VQRTIAAPIDGYIASAEARPGDVVSSGEPIGALDDSDLRLERLKWSTLRQQMVSELREARAQNDRAEVSIITAKIDQANAELELVDEQLARTRLTAPFDGIVIEGDLSQRLGTPVKRGEQLFLLAPLEDYRIVLKVDEQDIRPVDSRQHARPPGRSGGHTGHPRIHPG
jgi:multidrug resistance efflux pump